MLLLSNTTRNLLDKYQQKEFPFSPNSITALIPWLQLGLPLSSSALSKIHQRGQKWNDETCHSSNLSILLTYDMIDFPSELSNTGLSSCFFFFSPLPPPLMYTALLCLGTARSWHGEEQPKWIRMEFESAIFHLSVGAQRGTQAPSWVVAPCPVPVAPLMWGSVDVGLGRHSGLLQQCRLAGLTTLSLIYILN